jgi:hypothetical protein
MSFRIFAAGVPKFNYIKDKLPDGEVFEAVKVIHAFTTMDPSFAGAGGASSDIILPDITDVVKNIAGMQFAHLLNNAVCCLAMQPAAQSGWISVAATEKNTLWADTVRHVKYNFSPGVNPGAEFMKKVSPALKDTSMDNFGVLFGLASACTKYYNSIDDKQVPMLNIQLTK